MVDDLHGRQASVGALRVSALCLGGNVFGWTADDSQSFAVLDAFAAAGGTFVDTADSYSAWVTGNEGGESEAIIGRWLSRGGRRREDAVIATKVGAHPALRGLAPETIKRAAEESLRRLNTDHIDLYYTHFDDESVPVDDIVTALDELVQAGKVREIGASNISADRLAASLDFSRRESKAAYVALQPHYNLLARDGYEGGLADVAARHGLAAMPYAALAAGFLTGKYRPDAPVSSARSQRAGQHLATERGRLVLAALDEVAGARGVEPSTVAVAWLAAQPTVVAPIASARTPEQLPPLLAAAGLALTQAELAVLNAA